MDEQSGVRLGQRVVDADGKPMGKVRKLYPWGFVATRGFPVLTRRDEVIRYDEVRGARDGALVVARSAHDLLELAAGGIPRSWRIPAPPGYPAAATPSEARLVLEDIAAGAAFSRLAPDEPLVATAPEAPPLTRQEELVYTQTRGQATAAETIPAGDGRRAGGVAAPDPSASRPGR